MLIYIYMANSASRVGRWFGLTAILVAFVALGLGLYVLLRPVSVFDLKEVSYFPRGIVDPVRASVNRIMAKAGSAVTMLYNADKAVADRELAKALTDFERNTTMPMTLKGFMS